MMTGFQIKRVGHVGIWVDDLDAMESFYKNVLGFLVSDRIVNKKDQVSYLTRNPTEHHQLVLSVNKSRSNHSSSLQNIAFRVQSLKDLKEAHNRLTQDDAASGITASDHGNTWSIHFQDVENNNCEIFCVTPWRVVIPFDEPLDLTKPIENIIETSREMAYACECTKTAGEWQAETIERLRS